MPINSYDGETFVAFVDICGFKELMRNENKAWGALDRLYQSGYDVLRAQKYEYKVEGIFISDSGVLFVRKDNRTMSSDSQGLKSLLAVIARISKKMTERDFMLTTSIAYGRFRYQKRIEFPGIGKGPIYGDAYVSALLDNENGNPKTQPGQCRIVRKNLPDEVNNAIKHEDSDQIFRMIRERRGDNKHYYFYWMVNHPGQIKEFEERYKRYRGAYNLKFKGMLEALKGNRY